MVDRPASRDERSQRNQRDGPEPYDQVRRPANLADGGLLALVVVAAAGGAILATSSKGGGRGRVFDEQPGQRRLRPGTGPAAGARGTIKSIDGSTVTVTTSSNATVKVVAGSNTVITDTAKGTINKLKPGDHVHVLGSAGTAGVVSAQVVIDSGDLTLGGGIHGARGTGAAGRPRRTRPEGSGAQGGQFRGASFLRASSREAVGSAAA